MFSRLNLPAFILEPFALNADLKKVIDVARKTSNLVTVPYKMGGTGTKGYPLEPYFISFSETRKVAISPAAIASIQFFPDVGETSFSKKFIAASLF